MKRRFPIWTWLIWLALPVLLWLAWRQVPLDHLWLTLQSIQGWQVAVLVFLNALILLSFNMRWWVVLSALGHSLPYLFLTAYRLAGFTVSYLTPGTQFGGEPLQIALLHRRHNLPVSTSLASVTLDKLLELLANYLFLAFLLLAAVLAGSAESFLSINLVWPLLGLLFMPMGHLAAMRHGFRPLTRLLARIASAWKTPKVAGLYQLVQQAEDQVGVFCQDHLSSILFSVNFSLGVWVLSAFEHWLVYAFFGMRLTLAQLVVMVAAMRLAFLTPFPGGLGALEASQILALQALGLDPAFGVGAVLWIRVRDLVLAGIGAWLGAVFSRAAPAVPQAEEVTL